MRIHLHIERVVLDGVPVSATERPLLHIAMETELTELLRNGELSDELRAGTALAHLRAGAVRVGKDSNAKRLGTDIAHVVFQGLGHGGRRRSTGVDRRLSAENRQPMFGGKPR
jgi:hypothetical protein